MRGNESCGGMHNLKVVGSNPTPARLKYERSEYFSLLVLVLVLNVRILVGQEQKQVQGKPIIPAANLVFTF